MLHKRGGVEFFTSRQPGRSYHGEKTFDQDQILNGECQSAVHDEDNDPFINTMNEKFKRQQY